MIGRIIGIFEKFLHKGFYEKFQKQSFILPIIPDQNALERDACLVTERNTASHAFSVRLPSTKPSIG